MRQEKSFQVDHIYVLKNRLLSWASHHDHAIWLDSNDYALEHSSFDAVLALGAEQVLSADAIGSLDRLHNFINGCSDWIFGYLSYDVKNDVEDLASSNHDGLGFPDLCFFQPRKLIFLKAGQITFSYLSHYAADIDSDFRSLSKSSILDTKPSDPIKIHLRIHKDSYLQKVSDILAHIHRGDIYEVNFCQEFYADNTHINPLEIYKYLNAISKPPFATFLKLEDKFLLSASPERYLRKKGDTIISQPIKGTAGRATDPGEDNELKRFLESDPKERSENIMIVDLVRNDLARNALRGSVKVEELCKVYSFEQVHQMISTVSAKVNPRTHPVDLIRGTFPMGSMTGAPKISAMKIIEEFEETRRGLYSGAVGYISPEGDFDFNVVIRSILYNASKGYVSYSVGSAITAKSDPYREYEECLIKAKAMRSVLEEPSNEKTNSGDH